MSLQNSLTLGLKIGQLLEHETDAAEVQRLLRAARRALQDAMNDSVGAETRFDAAYRTIIQSLPLTIGSDALRVAVLDRLRHKRNVIDYTGEEIDDASVAACIEEAEHLIDDVEGWTTVHHPDLLKQAL